MIVGLDMGGTHIDAVIIKEGRILNYVKKPTNKDKIFESIEETLNQLLENFNKEEIERINLSTTISTNAIVEDTVSPVAMLIQTGPGLPKDFLACGDENLFISGYIDHRGNEVEKYSKVQVIEGVKQFKEKGIKSCGVVSKFSTRNPKVELEIGNLIKREANAHITLGHTMSGRLNFPRRVFTSYLNAAVYNTFNKFAKSIKRYMEKERLNCPLFVLKADGGTMDLKAAQVKPVETILSGPAASFMGINAMFKGKEDAILLDMGGTTTDIFFLAQGVPLFEPLGIEIERYKTLVRAIYSVSIGLGGDSSIEIVENKIKIGPERKGRPYAYGGPMATPTDAMIVLGLIDNQEEEVKSRAHKIIKDLGKKLNLSPRDMATYILDTMANIIKVKVNKLLYQINSQPVYTIEELLYGDKIKPKLINIIGGPAKVLAPIIEKKFQLPTHYPKNHQIANAIGAALARTTAEINMLVDTSQGALVVPELEVYEKIGRGYNLDQARDRALELVKKSARNLGARDQEIEAEIVEESSFNIVRGFFTSGQSIRIKAQVKPGLIFQMGGDMVD